MKDYLNYGTLFLSSMRIARLNRVKSLLVFTKVVLINLLKDFQLAQNDFSKAMFNHKLMIWNRFLQLLSSNMLEVQIIDRLRTR
jgi:hypothetical protein